MKTGGLRRHSYNFSYVLGTFQAYMKEVKLSHWQACNELTFIIYGVIGNTSDFGSEEFSVRALIGQQPGTILKRFSMVFVFCFANHVFGNATLGGQLGHLLAFYLETYGGTCGCKNIIATKHLITGDIQSPIQKPANNM